MNALKQEQIAELRKTSDWNLDVQTIENSGIFPGPTRLAPADGLKFEFASSLAAEVLQKYDEANRQRKTFGIVCQGIRYRVQPLEFPYFQLRTLHDKALTPEELGIPAPYTDILLSRELRNRGGLVLFGGPTGSGKTTSASAISVKRLELYGGYLLTLEDVIEYKMDGWHGDRGLCRQVQIQGDYREEMRWALRAFPSNDRSMLMFGEICDDIAAGELLRTALDGHLVLTTMHGNNIVALLNRLIMIARREMDIAEARALLAQSLRVVVHQIREHTVPQVTMLNLLDKDAQGAINIIGNHEVRLDQLNQTISSQQLRFQRAIESIAA